ncbi:MAG: uroporphyrinogen decarboxylase family protein [Candidatus Latescibacterota bacterium]
MTQRERLLAVYRGETPDLVPFMLDLSHWYYWRHRQPWDLSVAYPEPERGLIDYHRQAGAGFYMPNLGAFYTARFADGVKAVTERREEGGAPEIVWRLETPIGTIERARRWEERTYAWGISRWGIHTERDLEVFAQAMSRRVFAPCWENWRAWSEYVGDLGVVYLPAGYSAMGYLLHYWMGVEQVVYAATDCPAVLRRAVDAVNANNLRMIDLLCASPAEVVILGDNFSSDIQSPAFFATWSRDYYLEAMTRLRRAGKYTAVHIDGRLQGAIAMIRDAGADCGDAITPLPIGDLSPAQCRTEAGPGFILSGGVSPELWLPQTPLAVFERKVIEWLELRHESPRLIAAAGDQVPPGADEARIHRMRELVEEHGRY